MFKNSDKIFSILRLIPSIEITSAPYNQFSLALGNKHNITICTYFKSLSRISLPGTITFFEGDGSLTGFLRTLEKAIEERKYDIIHSHTPHVGFLFLVATRKKFLRNTIHTVHSSYPNYKLRNQLMLLPVFALFQRVVFCSYASLNSFPRLFRQLVGNRNRVVQNGVDINRIDRTVANVSKDAQQEYFTVVTVGRLIDLKNTRALLRAFHESSNPTCQLLFIGEGYLKTSLIIERKKLDLEKQVQFTGLISRERVYKHLVEANLFVSTSRIEGLPVAVLEAMVCGLPVVLSDIPPHREIANGATFIPLINPDNVARFAQEIDRFRQMPLSMRAEIGRKCRQIAVEKFSLTNMHRKYTEIYKEMTGKY